MIYVGCTFLSQKVTWPHERPQPHFTSYRLLLNNHMSKGTISTGSNDAQVPVGIVGGKDRGPPHG